MIGGGNLAGGVQPQSTDNLSEDANAALHFLRSKVPEVATLPLATYATQVVAGANHFFTFVGHDGTYTVWSQPWNNGFLEITLPDGNKISNH